jgi:hypothetical protein
MSRKRSRSRRNGDREVRLEEIPPEERPQEPRREPKTKALVMDLMITPAPFDNPDRRPDQISRKETRPTGPDLESQPVQWRKAIQGAAPRLRDEAA